jgi:hypothetical protein
MAQISSTTHAVLLVTLYDGASDQLTHDEIETIQVGAIDPRSFPIAKNH